MVRRLLNRGYSGIWALAVLTTLAWRTDLEGSGVSIRELLRERGVSAELLKAERAHPYLFFSAEDVPRLRELAVRPPYRACAEGIVRAARLTLGNPIPAEPPAGAAESRAPDGSYDESFLKATYDFLSYAYAMEYYGPLYAFAYLLTGEDAFVEGENGIGARLSGGDGEALAIFRTGEGAVRIDGFHTDARACLVETAEDGRETIALHGGTFVERGGRCLFASDEPVSVRVEIGVR